MMFVSVSQKETSYIYTGEIKTDLWGPRGCPQIPVGHILQTSQHLTIYLHHHEDLGRGLDDMIQTTDVLVTQILHSFDLHLDPGQVILGKQRIPFSRMTFHLSIV